MALLLALLCFALPACGRAAEAHSATTFAMDTIIDQRAYGPNAQEAMRRVNAAFAEWEGRLSLFAPGSEVARINAAAGAGGAEVSPETAALIEAALNYGRGEGRGGFALSIAPLTLAWGVTTDAPRVPADDEIAALLPLVDDAAIKVEGSTVALDKPGMGIDLGGIAKGAACDAAAAIYAECGVDSALLWAGGSVYARGTKPDGSRFSVGFADPAAEGSAYIAAFEMEDAFIAVSGGYERYFEAGGRRYIHIINPATGRPAESDIVSVGVIDGTGAGADFASTDLFVAGRDAALSYMEAGGRAIVLDKGGVLWVSAALKEGFTLHNKNYELRFVEAKLL